MLKLSQLTAGVVLIFLGITGNSFASPFSFSQQIENPTPNHNDNFGWSVATDGSRVVVGTPFDDTIREGTLNGDSGAVYLYDGNSGDLLQTILNPSPTFNGSRFGNSVAISGDYIVVGDDLGDAPRPDSSNLRRTSGVAYVFNSTTGELVHTLASPEPQFGEQFGVSVAIDGTNIVVGSNLDNVAAGRGLRAGAVHVFDAISGDLTQTLTSPNAHHLASFGFSVDISGDLVVVGESEGNTNNVTNSGAAYVFDLNDGSLVSTLEDPSISLSNQFGWSASIDGTNVLIGAPGTQLDGVGKVGAAYSYDALNGSLLNTLENPTPGLDDWYGGSLDVWGDNAVVMSRHRNPDGTRGAVYLYSLTDREILQTLVPDNGTWFGQRKDSVALSPTMLVLGDYPGDGNAVVFTGDITPPPIPLPLGGSLSLMILGILVCFRKTVSFKNCQG